MPASDSRISIARRPGIREALRVVFSGPGLTEWISPGRRRVLRWSLFVAGLVVGLLSGAFVVRMPEGTFDGESGVIAGLILVVLVALYFVHDVVLSMELIEKRQAESDLDLARQIQQRMLPHELPTIDGYAIAVYHEPARSVGGDAYDALVLEDGNVFLTVADVSGKGAAAALLMSGVLARTRALARTGMPIGELAARLSSALDQETETIHFATCVLVLLEPRTGILRYVNAGNEPPVVLRRDGSRVELPTGGLPVGMLPNARYQSGQAFLGVGERLVVATDGVFDGDDAGNPLLESEELLRMVAEASSAQDAADAVRAEVRRRAPDGQFDDITLLIVERTG